MSLVRWDPFRTVSRWDPLRASRWDPFRELEEMSERLNRLTTRATPAGEEELVLAEWAPVVDIEETDKEYVIKAELPEVKKDDVKVAIKDGVLTIEGERKQEKEEKGTKFHRVERSYGKFMRSFVMPKDTDEKKITADFKDGILKVHVGKSEFLKPKTIDIKVA